MVFEKPEGRAPQISLRRASEGETYPLNHPFRPLRPVRELFESASIARHVACLVTGLLPVTAIVLTGISSATAADQPAASGKAKQGEAIFKTQCIGCHNKAPDDTSPFGPPNLHGLLRSKPAVLTPQQAAETIRKGKGVMPAFEGKLSATEISSVVAYLKTM